MDSKVLRFFSRIYYCDSRVWTICVWNVWFSEDFYIFTKYHLTIVEKYMILLKNFRFCEIRGMFTYNFDCFGNFVKYFCMFHVIFLSISENFHRKSRTNLLNILIFIIISFDLAEKLKEKFNQTLVLKFILKKFRMNFLIFDSNAVEKLKWDDNLHAFYGMLWVK